jgi:CubicO group peptidase (beta-lactamase class C family)
VGTFDDNVGALRQRARRDVEDGLLPSCQLALARHGELVAFETYGDATPRTRYAVFSCTKPFVAGVMWGLIGDGLVDVAAPVVAYVPEFGTHGKDVITVEQLMLHTAGFPQAPLGPPAWDTREGRLAAFARWRLNWEPGTSYEYHATSAHWVLAEIIDRVTGRDYRDVVVDRVTTPAGLPRVLGLADGPEQDGIATLVAVGEEATPEEIRTAFGVDELPPTEATVDACLQFNRPDVRAVGVPGAGAIMRAADLALFHQALLTNPGGMWKPDVLANVTSVVRNRLLERRTGVAARRTLGLVLAGDDGWAAARGFGRTVSGRAFGHNGAGGQLAWADPSTGLSFAYCTNGFDAHVVRAARRGTALCSLAGACAS